MKSDAGDGRASSPNSTSLRSVTSAGVFVFCFFAFLLFRAEPVAHGGSQARGQIRAVATSLCHSHSN